MHSQAPHKVCLLCSEKSEDKLETIAWSRLIEYHPIIHADKRDVGQVCLIQVRAELFENHSDNCFPLVGNSVLLSPPMAFPASKSKR